MKAANTSDSIFNVCIYIPAKKEGENARILVENSRQVARNQDAANLRAFWDFASKHKDVIDGLNDWEWANLTYTNATNPIALD